MDWRDCNKNRFVKNVSIDKNEIASLIKSSSNKLKSEALLSMSDITAVSKISLAYDSLRELLEAIALSRGYKIYNHECYCAFLKEILNKSDLGDEFDEFRRIRNSVNYYGKKVSPAEANVILKRIRGFIEKVREQFSELFKQ